MPTGMYQVLLSVLIDFAGIFAVGPEVLRQLVKKSTTKDLPPTQAKVALIVFQHASWKMRCKMIFRAYPLDSQVHNGQLDRNLNIYKPQAILRMSLSSLKEPFPHRFVQVEFTLRTVQLCS